MLKVTSDILLNMDNKKVTMLVLLDLSAAFDTVDHDILLHVLSDNFGVKDNVKSWFHSYLRPRTQSVMVEESIAGKQVLNQGVPQGSCAGPVLYTAYASTLSQTISKHLPEVMGYADDHALYLAFQAGDDTLEHDAVSAMEDCLQDVKLWMNLNRLKMNNAKSEFIIFGTRMQLTKLGVTHITIGSCNTNCQDNVKYLGVYLDDNLSMQSSLLQFIQH